MSPSQTVCQPTGLQHFVVSTCLSCLLLAAGLEDSQLELHHIVVNSWDRPGGVCAEQNVVLVSIASGK